MDKYYNGTVKVSNIDHIINNYSIYRSDETSHTTELFNIKYDNSLLFIQTPMASIYNEPNCYKGIFKLGICFQSYKKNPVACNFVEKLMKIDNHFKSIAKKLFTRESDKMSRWSSFIRFNENETNAYIDLTLQKKYKEPILSVYDHNKMSRGIDYITKYSDSINIIHLKNIWQKDNVMGVNWCIIQTKIFKPIIELDECIIEDEYENMPMKHYHKTVINSIIVNNTLKKKSPDESHPKLGKYVKMKRLGVPQNIIELGLLRDNISPAVFNKYLDTGECSDTDKVSHNNIIIKKDMLTSIKLKPRKPIKYNMAPNVGKSRSNQCIPTELELNNIISKLRSTKHNTRE